MNEQCYYRVSVKGIAIDEQGRILLARDDDNRWEMLGGGLDHNENPIECLRREILEETGLKVVRISEAPKYFVTAPRVGTTITTYMANIIYEIQLESLDFIPSDECKELRFFSKDEMKDIDLLPNVEKLRELL